MSLSYLTSTGKHRLARAEYASLCAAALGRSVPRVHAAALERRGLLDDGRPTALGRAVQRRIDLDRRIELARAMMGRC